MRVLVFHGYLLHGTGSNVYNARLASALAGLGHEVHLLSQERRPQELGFVTAAGDWDSGSLLVRTLRESAPGAGSCTVYRPDIGGLLPVYVADRYEALEARTFADCSEEEVERYVTANVDAVAEVAALARPQVALANHLVMGPLVLARALGGRVPYAVKVHGSALEYTVKPQPARFLPAAREGLQGAAGVLVGSRHTARSLWEALADPSLPARTRLGPPGVDVAQFTPRPAREAVRGLEGLAAELTAPREQAEAAEDAFARDPAEAGRALARIAAGEGPLVAYVGKLIVSKGVDLLIAAWPLVLCRFPGARLAVCGFGAYRGALEELAAALAAGDLGRAREIAVAGRALERARADGPGEAGAPAQPLRHLLAFLESLASEEREAYVQAARALPAGLTFTGRLEHEELACVLPAAEAVVVPSTFPEAFGMVAAEAAACGALPVSAGHSGLAEVSQELARGLPAQAAGWLSFPVDDGSVAAIAERLCGWLGADDALRSEVREGLVATVRERWSWEGVARGVIAAAQGRLEELGEPL